MTLDATDRSILEALGLDSRKSHRQLARELGVAQGTVTNRIRRLEERGVIQGYGVRVDPEQVGWSMTIIAGLRIAKGAMLRVQRGDRAGSKGPGGVRRDRRIRQLGHGACSRPF